MIGISYTRSSTFPLTPDALDTTNYSPGGYYEEAAVSKLSADLSQLLFSSYWGGSDADRAYAGLKDGSDSVWVGGFTWARDFPITDDAIRRTGGGWPTNFLSHLYVGTGSGVPSPRVLAPEDLTLTCYPNPFNATTILRFELPRAGSARLLVYDLLGREALDQDCGTLPAGEHRHTLDVSDLPSGIYFARLEALGLERVQKMVILR